MSALLVTGYLTIDTIVTPQGREDGVPGGAALYAALAARVAAGGSRLRIVLAASVGEDYPQAWLDGLAARGIDTGSVERRPGPTRRSHLAHAVSGERRSPHFRDPAFGERTAALAPPRVDPSGFDRVVAAPMRVEDLAGYVEKAGGRIVADTSEAIAETFGSSLMRLLPRIGVFAPSREETRLLLPGLSDDAAALTLAGLGPRVVQKRGGDGVLIRDGVGAAPVAIAAATVPAVVDPTGAGDTLVGALAASLAVGAEFPDAVRSAMGVAALTLSDLGPRGLSLTWDMTTGREARACA